METLKVKLGVYPSATVLSKLVSLFSSLDSVAYIENEDGSKRVLAKSIIGLLSFRLRQYQNISITFYGDYAKNDAIYIERELRLL